MTGDTAQPEDAVARIERFRGLADGWHDGHRGITATVADAAMTITHAAGADDIFPVPFDGAVVLHRVWPHSPLRHGRSLEVLPGGRMSLVADFPYEEGDEHGYDLPLDVARAVAWLLTDTRSTPTGPEAVAGLTDLLTLQRAWIWWDTPQDAWNGATARQMASQVPASELLAQARYAASQRH